MPMTIREEANHIVALCLRNNTILEDLHADGGSQGGRINDDEIRRLMIEVCSNVELVLELRDRLPDRVYHTILRAVASEAGAWDTENRTGGLWEGPPVAEGTGPVLDLLEAAKRLVREALLIAGVSEGLVAAVTGVAADETDMVTQDGEVR